METDSWPLEVEVRLELDEADKLADALAFFASMTGDEGAAALMRGVEDAVALSRQRLADPRFNGSLAGGACPP